MENPATFFILFKTEKRNDSHTNKGVSSTVIYRILIVFGFM